MYFQAIHQAELHLLEVTKEWSLYKKMIDTAKPAVHQFSSSGKFSPPLPAEEAAPCSRSISAHYSFDVAK